METAFNIKEGQRIEGTSFSPTRETIWEFCEASLDYNPLHWDDEYMKSDFGKTNFGGIIMHGMSNFSLITKMMTDWALPQQGTHRRLETRWKSPVKPGDTITPSGIVKKVKVTEKANWVVVSVEVKNQEDKLVAEGEAMVEFPL
ncbi:MAG TPA: MaoC family dehydratase [Burkholderiaceae bacterium]|nr:MaoC family dehydratase [Burkholderiaceae bacterium]